MIRFLWVGFIFIWLSPIANAQYNKSDSLKKTLLGLNENVEKIFVLNELSKELREKNTEDALLYAQQAFLLAQKFNHQKGISEALFAIGVAYYDLSSYHKSLDYFNKALSFFKTLSNQKYIVACTRNIGNIHYQTGDFEKALTYYLESLELSEQIEDEIGIAGAYTNIGNVYIKLNYLDKALLYFQNAAKSFETLKDARGIAINNINLGNVYEELGQYNKALIHYQESQKINEKLGYKLAVAESLTNIGGIYIKTNNYNKALEYYLRALKIQETVKDKRGAAITLAGIADIYTRSDNTERSIDYYKKSLDISLEARLKEISKKNYEKLANLYEQKGDLKTAYQYQKLFKLYTDSLFNDAKLKLLSELQVRFDLQNKEKEIEFLNKENNLKEIAYNNQQIDLRNQRFLTTIFVIGIILVLLLAYILYRDMIRKNKINEALMLKNEEISYQKNEIEEKNKQIQKAYTQITDSIRYAQTIQNAILPSHSKMIDSFSDYFIIYRAKDIVSGDFYWVNKIGNQVFVAVVDCTGHGVSGALMSMIGNTLLNEIINENKIYVPSEILEHMHKGVSIALEKRSIDIPLSMEVCLCRLEPVDYDDNKMILTFAGARRPLFYIQNNEMTELKGDKKSVGFNPDDKKVFNDRCLEVQKGGMLYLTTDGFIDQFSPSHKRFGSTRFKELLQSDLFDKDMRQQHHFFEQSLKEHQQNTPQQDDITILGIMV